MDKSRGFPKLKRVCNPIASVTPQRVASENRYGVATTVITMGSEPLVIRQGDTIAEARLCGDVEFLHDASRGEAAVEACAATLEAKFPGDTGSTDLSNHGKVCKLHENLAGIPNSKASVDGLKPEHPEFGVTGSQSADKVMSSCHKFRAWAKEAKPKLRFGKDHKLSWQARKLLYCDTDIFATNTSAPSPIAGVQHSTDLVIGETVHPRKERLRRCPPPKEPQVMYDETEKMPSNGIIQPSTSAWAANVRTIPTPSDQLGGLRYH